MDLPSLLEYVLLIFVVPIFLSGRILGIFVGNLYFEAHPFSIGVYTLKINFKFMGLMIRSSCWFGIAITHNKTRIILGLEIGV